MKTISTTEVRKEIATLINRVNKGAVFAIGRRENPEALLIKFPTTYNKKVNEITNINAYSESFNFLESEPDLYSVDDMKKSYV